MKNIDKKFLLLGFSAMAFCVLAPAVYAQNDGTVSAIGKPSPSATTPEFPPQPVGVAPTEEVAPVTTTPSSPKPPAPVAAVPAPVVKNPVTPPSAGLTPGLTPIPGESADSVTGTNVMGDTGKTRHSGTYYDADALVPDADLSAAGATGPRKVDPAIEPGQKYVIVEKGPGAT